MPGETQAGPGFTFDDDSAAAPKPTSSFTFDDDAAPAKAPSYTFDPVAPKDAAVAPTAPSFSFDDEKPSSSFTFDDEAAPAQKKFSEMSDPERRALAETEYNKTVGDKLSAAPGKFAEGAAGLAKQAAGVVQRNWRGPLGTVYDAATGKASVADAVGAVMMPGSIFSPASQLEGAVDQVGNDAGIVNKIGQAAYDNRRFLTGSEFTDADMAGSPEVAKSQWKDSWIAKQLDAEKEQENAAKPTLPQGLRDVLGEPNMEDAGVAGLAGSPMMLGPQLLRKGAGAATAAGAGTSVVGEGLQTAGKALTAVAKAPQTFASWLAEKLTGSEAAGKHAADAVAKIEHTGGGASALIHGELGGNPLAAIAQGLTAAKLAGGALTKGGEAASAVLPKLGVQTAQDLFEQVAKDGTAAMWIRSASKTLAQDYPALSRFLEGALKTGRGAVEGAAINTGLGIASGDDSDKLAEAAGTGAAFGAGMHIMHGIGDSVSGAKVRQAADNLAWSLKMSDIMQKAGMSDVDAKALLARIHPDNVNQMATYDQITGGKLDFEILDGKTFAARYPGQAGNAGFYDPTTKRFAVNADSGREARGQGSTFLHEMGHAVYDQSANKEQWRAHINALGPEFFEKFSNGYAEQLAMSELRASDRAQGLNPTDADLKARVGQAEIDAKKTQLSAMDPDWVYSEQFAEQAAQTLYGRDIRQDVLRPSEAALDRSTGVTDTGFVRKTLQSLFPPKLTDMVRAGYKPSMILQHFPEFDSPQGRRLLYDAIRTRNNTVEGLTKGGDAGDTGLVLNKEVAQDPTKHPMPYNPATGQHEGEFYTAANPTPFNPPQVGEGLRKGVKYDLKERTRASVSRSERTRAMEVRDNLAGGPARPPGDVAVGPRVGDDGKTTIAGTQIAPQIAGFKTLSEGVKQHAADIDEAIAKGQTIHFNYQAIASGAEGKSYAADLKKNKGNKIVTERNAVPYSYEVTGKNNIVVKVLDLTTAEKKATAWSEGNKLGDWGHKPGDFLTDVRQVLQNHAAGQPGDANGIGKVKLNQINAFIAGDIKGARQYNPLRGELSGSDRAGIVRSFRLDRIASLDKPTLAPGQEIGGPVSYPKVRRNVSPDVHASPDVAGPTHNPQMVELVKKYVPEFDNIHPSFWQQKPTDKAGARKQNQIAREYSQLKTDNLSDPRVMRSYEALSKKVVAQFDDILRTAKVESWEQPGQPYKNSAEMQHDLINNNHLYYFPTSEGYGQGDGNYAQRHPMLQDSGRKDINGRPMLVNDVFRAVHDAIAHSAFGLQFGPAGEEAAWRVHSATIEDPWARQALTAETRGQNSWVNFQDKHMGPEGPLKKGDQGYVPFAEREFADQKADILPWRDSLTGDSTVDAPVLQDRELTGRSDIERGGPAGSLPPGAELDHQGTPSTDISQPGQEGAARRFASPDIGINTNGWLLPDGKFMPNRTGEDHPDAARRIAGVKTGRQSLPGGAYRPYFDKGWLRVVRQPGGNVMVDNASQPLNLTKGQRATLEDHSFGGNEVTHDTRQGARTIFDAQHGPSDIAASPDQEAQDADQRINSRRPFGKNAVNEGFDRAPSLEAIKSDPKLVGKIADKIRSYRELRLPGRANDVKTVDQFSNFVKDNILWLHDQMDPGLRERSSKWYDGARKLTEDWSTEFGVPRQAVAGVLAALSPQKDWFMNISMARRVLETVRDHQDTVATPAMADFGNRISKIYPDLKPIVDSVAGKKFSELDGDEKALWLRLHDETTRDRGYRITTPEGEDMGAAKNDSGSDAAAGWGSLNEIGKALKVLADPRREAIETTLGNPHKVRSFYNNIILPNEPTHGDVTVDTHAVAAGLLQPLAAKDPQVIDNFSSPSHAETGSKGLYPVYAEAYRAAAKERGILPRQMQSITWEAVRGLFGESFKNADNKALVKQLWQDYSRGKASLDETRSKILKLADGIDAPPWHQPDPDWSVAGDEPGSAGHGDEFAAPTQGAGDEGELHQPGLPGSAAGGVGAGAGGTAAGELAPEGRIAASPDAEPLQNGSKYWLAPDGTFHYADEHEDWAALRLKGKQPHPSGDMMGNSIDLIKKGWVRVADVDDQAGITLSQNVRQPLKLTKAQKTALEDQSFEGYDVHYDDNTDRLKTVFKAQEPPMVDPDTGERSASPDIQPPAVVGSANPGQSRGYGFPKGTSFDVLKDYDRQVIRSIAGASGRSVRFLDHLGIENTISQGAGTFDRLEPNITLTLPGSSFEEATHVAALMGDALLQDAIIPVQPAPDGENYGSILRRPGKPFSHGELLKIYAEVNPSKSTEGLNFSLTKTKDGLLFLDPAQFTGQPYDASKQLAEFQNSLAPTAEKYGLESLGHRQNSRYIDSSEYADLSQPLLEPSAARPRVQVGRADRPGVQRAGAGDSSAQRAVGSLFRPIWRVYSNFAASHGFKPANVTAPHERFARPAGRGRGVAEPAVQR